MGSQEPVVVNPPTQESHKATRPSAGTSVTQPVRNQTPQRRQVPQRTVPQSRSRIDSLQEVSYLLQSYRNAHQNNSEVDARVKLALKILDWINKNFDEQTKKNFLSFLRETYGDGKISYDNKEVGAVVAGVLVYMFNDVRVLMSKKTELGNDYDKMHQRIVTFYSNLFSKLAGNRDLARDVGRTIAEYESQITKKFSEGWNAVLTKLQLTNADDFWKNILDTQRMFFRGELDTSFSQRILFEVASRVGLANSNNSINRQLTFFKRDFGDGQPIVTFNLDSATTVNRNGRLVGTNPSLKIEFVHTRTYRALMELNKQLNAHFKGTQGLFDDNGKLRTDKQEYRKVIDMLRADYQARTNLSLEGLSDFEVVKRLAYLTMFYTKPDREFATVPLESSSYWTSIESVTSFSQADAQRNSYWVFNPNHQKKPGYQNVPADQEHQLRAYVFGVGFAAYGTDQIAKLVGNLRKAVEETKKYVTATQSILEGERQKAVSLLKQYSGQISEEQRKKIEANLDLFVKASQTVIDTKARGFLSAVFNGAFDGEGNLTLRFGVPPQVQRGSEEFIVKSIKINDNQDLQSYFDPRKLPIYVLTIGENATELINILSSNQISLEGVVGNFLLEQGTNLQPVLRGSTFSQRQEAQDTTSSTVRAVVLQSMAIYEQIGSGSAQPQTQFVQISQASREQFWEIDPQKKYSYNDFISRKGLRLKDKEGNEYVALLSYQKTTPPDSFSISIYRLDDVIQQEDGTYRTREGAQSVHSAQVSLTQIQVNNQNVIVFSGQDLINALDPQGRQFRILEKTDSSDLSLSFRGRLTEGIVSIPQGTELFKGRDQYGEFTVYFVGLVPTEQNNAKVRVVKKYSDNRELGIELDAKVMSIGDRTASNSAFTYLTFDKQQLTTHGITHAVAGTISVASGSRFRGISFLADEEVLSKGINLTLKYSENQELKISLQKTEEGNILTIGDSTFKVSDEDLTKILGKQPEQNGRTVYTIDLVQLQQIINQQQQASPSQAGQQQPQQIVDLKLGQVESYSLEYKGVKTQQRVEQKPKTDDTTVTPSERPVETIQPPQPVVEPPQQPPQVRRPRARGIGMQVGGSFPLGRIQISQEVSLAVNGPDKNAVDTFCKHFPNSVAEVIRTYGDKAKLSHLINALNQRYVGRPFETPGTSETDPDLFEKRDGKLVLNQKALKKLNEQMSGKLNITFNRKTDNLDELDVDALNNILQQMYQVYLRENIIPVASVQLGREFGRTEVGLELGLNKRGGFVFGPYARYNVGRLDVGGGYTYNPRERKGDAFISVGYTVRSAFFNIRWYSRAESALTAGVSLYL